MDEVRLWLLCFDSQWIGGASKVEQRFRDRRQARARISLLEFGEGAARQWARAILHRDADGG